jgi:hypothetical protein
VSPYSVEKIGSLPTNGQVDDTLLRWNSDGDEATFIWNQVNSFNSISNSAVYSYSVISPKISKILSVTDNIISHFSSSSDSRYWAISFEGGNGIILDTILGGSLTIHVKNNSPQIITEPVSVDAMLWHSKQDWLFVLGDFGVSFWTDLNVINANGTIQRDLGICFLAPSCFGWLPGETPTF